MEYIQVTRENIESEHICCAISNNKDVQASTPTFGGLRNFERPDG